MEVDIHPGVTEAASQVEAALPAVEVEVVASQVVAVVLPTAAVAGVATAEAEAQDITETASCLLLIDRFVPMALWHDVSGSSRLSLGPCWAPASSFARWVGPGPSF